MRHVARLLMALVVTLVAMPFALKAQEAHMCSMRLSRRGLTLVELVVAIAIIGGLGYVLLPTLRKVAGFDETQLAIDAFIVTKARENVRLGLLEIQCARLGDVVAAAKYPVRRLKQEEDSLASKLEEKTKELEELEAELGQSKQLEEDFRAKDRALVELTRTVQRLEFERTSKERELEETMQKFDTASPDPVVDVTNRRRTPRSADLGDAPASVDGEMPNDSKTVRDDLPDHDGLKPELPEAQKEKIERLRKSLAESIERLAQARQAASQCTLSLTQLRSRRDDLQRRRGLLQPLKEEVRKIGISREAAADNFFRAVFATFPSPAFVAKTDADGKAVVRLNRDMPFLIWASCDRALPDGQVEQYNWLVRIPGGGSTKQTLFLSSDNLATQRSVLELLGVGL
jgi:prepilin-type N-terminal cleavage/methylation domain-containing protein